MSVIDETSPPAERPIGQVRGTRDWLPGDLARLARLEQRLLDRFALAGYEPLRTPVLEFTELHERKSGAGIVSKLYGVDGDEPEGLCLRPELTASVVRAYTAADEPPNLPWRVSMAGPVFRREKEPREGVSYREFQQVGVELLGASGPEADAEVIWLAEWSLRMQGLAGTIRIGHVGLILEVLRRSGLPPAAGAALVETLSEAAAEGRDVRALDAALERLAGWLKSAEGEPTPPVVDGDAGVDRLFRTLVPDVTGRRSGREILGRLRRKWELAHTLPDVLARFGGQVHELAGLRGPAREVIGRLERDFAALAPESVAELRALVELLDEYGIDVATKVELDLGFGRGIGFYSQMIFSVAAPTPDGPVEVAGGGRYDGLARVLGSDRDARGAGFAFGLERLLHVLDARPNWPREPRAPRGLLVIPSTPADRASAVLLATFFRTRRDHAVLELGLHLDAALARARQLGIAFVIVAAGHPRDPGTLTLHEVATGRAKVIDEDDMARLSPFKPGSEL